MALTYDELGNVVGEDNPSVDQMRYELSLPKTIQRMATSHANDVSALGKAQTYKDIASGFGSAGESLLRGAGAAAFGVTGDILKHFQDTPFIPGVTDKITLNNIFPGSESLMPKQEQPYQIQPKHYPNVSYPAPRAKQEIMGLPYATTADILEAAPSRMTAPFGDKEANDFMETLGMFLQPSMQAGARQGIINMVETTGKMPSLTKESAQAFARDYTNALNGIYPEAPTVGSMAADFARQSKKVASGIEDVTVGNYQRAKVRKAAENVPEESAYDPLRQRREEQAVQTYTVPEGATPYYAVKPVGGQLVKSIDPVTGNLREVENSSVAGISQVYENVRKQTEGQGLINQYLRTYVNRPGIQEVWEDFNTKKIAEEFPNAPSMDDAREAFQIKYPTSKARNERMIQHFDEFAALPEAQAVAANLDISIPTFEDYQKRIAAANQWNQKGFPNYIQKFIGTKEDPGLAAATQGITFKDPERLIENAADALNYASPTGLREERTKAGFNPEGEIQPFLKEKLTELKAVDAQLREMVSERNSIQEQARAEGVNPEVLPAFDSIRRQIRDKTAEKERITQQAENYKLAKAYETLADLAIEPRTAQDLKKKLSFAEKQLFPHLDKTPDEAILYDIDPTTIERLGLTEMANKFSDDILSGKISLDQIQNTSIPKYIQEVASERIAKELAIKKDAKLREQKFNTYLEEQVQKIPTTMHFGNAGVLELTNAMSKDELIQHTSADTAILNHCIGQGGRENGKYIPIIDVVTGTIPKGSSGEPTVYVGNILKRGDVVGSIRDLVTGHTIGDVEFNKVGNNEYNIGYASGYDNGRMDPQYTEALKNYLNTKAEVIRGSGDNLAKNGIVDQEAMRRGTLRDITGLPDAVLEQLSYDGLPRFLSREDILELNNQRKSMLPSAQLNSEAATLNNAYADLLDENQQLNFELQNANDDLAREDLMSRRSEITSQLTDVNGRLNNLPIEDVTTFARELINDVFPENKKTARSRLAYLDDQSPISLRIQPRVYDLMREILRDERDAIGAPLSDAQQHAVMTEWQRVSDEVARSINGNMYSSRAVAGNIRRNPDRYGLADFNAQIIEGVARQVEQHGIVDVNNRGLIDNARPQEQRQDLAVVVDRMHDLIAEDYGQPVADYVRDALETINYNVNEDGPLYIESIRQFAAEDADDAPVRAAFNMVADRLVEGVRANIAGAQAARTAPVPQQIQAEPNAVQRVTLQAAQNEAFGVLDQPLNQDARNIVDMLAIRNPTQLNVISVDAMTEALRIRNGTSFRHLNDADRTALSNALDNFATEIAPRQAPAQRLANTNVGNVVQNLINQYPERNQIQALINDLEHGSYDELPMAIINADEIVRDDTVSQILEQLEEYRNTLPAIRAQNPDHTLNLPIAEAYQALIDEIASAMEEGSFDPNMHTNAELAQYILDDQVGGDVGNLTPESRERLAREVREYGVDPYHEPEDYRTINEEPRAALPAPQNPATRYLTERSAFNGIRDDNNGFHSLEEIDALRALPQLIRRPGATREALGISALNQDEIQELALSFERLYETRMQQMAARENNRLTPPEPEGHKRGGSIRKMKNGGEYNLPDLGNDEEEPRYRMPFIPPAMPYAASGVSGAKINRAIPIDKHSAVTLAADVSRSQNPSGTNYNVNEFGGGYHHKVGPGMLGISGSHRPGTHENRVNVMYAIPMKDGGSIQSSKNRLLSPNTDEMRFALMKGK